MNLMDFAAAIEAELDRALSGAEPEALSRAARHLCLSGAAKRARPLLVERFGQLLQVPPERLVPVGVAAELIHSASLLHDDVIDAASERRGRPSANALFGNRVAVLAGDLLIAIALDLVRPLPAGVTAAAVETVAAMTRAAMWELERGRDPALTAAGWERIARGKTGSLLAFCGRAAGLMAGDELAAAAFAEAAEDLGVAFQAADDLADLREGTGKPRFQDLQHGQPSLLTALAVQGDPALGQALERFWQGAGDADLTALALAVESSGAPAKVRTFIEAQVGRALTRLEPWLQGEAGQTLLHWGAALLEDDFFRPRGADEGAGGGAAIAGGGA